MRSAILLVAAPLLLAASAPVAPEAEPVDVELRRAEAEASAAEASARRFAAQADKARDEAAKLRAEQASAAEEIVAAEARLSAADAARRLATAQLAQQRLRLFEQQKPAASLLAGLAMMARRPPLLALAGGGVEDFVRVRMLLDSTLPVIRQRTAALSGEVARAQRLERAAADAQTSSSRGRDLLAERQRSFAALEAKALRMAAASGGAALSAGDVALSSGEVAERLSGESAGRRSAMALARELASLGSLPGRPSTEGKAARTPLPYRLPSDASVLEGLGEVSEAGVRSRGLTLATRRGAPLVVPASGIVRFAGPYRDYDGIVILDHGGGWISLLVNLASPLSPGTRVRAGDPLGRALGPVGVELSRNGQHWSPALIAGSSAPLSNGRKGG